MESAGSGATWTGSSKGVFSGRKHHKPRQSLNNNTAGVREREDENRTREAGNRDEVEGVVANTSELFRNGAVGFIDWLGVAENMKSQLIDMLKLRARVRHAQLQRRRPRTCGIQT